MTYSLQHAKYHDGALILDEELIDVRDGEEFDLLLLKKDNERLSMDEFLSRAAKHRFVIPDDYHFSEIKPMPDKCFLDSNLWIYLYGSGHSEIKSAIESVLRSHHDNIMVSTQTLGETYNVLTKKMSVPEVEAQAIIKDIARTVDIYEISTSDVFEAIRISQKYRYSFWDSLILQAAIMTGCAILYSEDMQDGQLIESKLRIVNPLAKV